MALDRLLAEDPEATQRQVGVIGAERPPAAWTGGGCLPACGHELNDGFAALGNTLASRSVVPSLAEGFATASGDLAARLVAGLAAGQEAGGDLRGRQSATLLVVSSTRDDAAPWEGVLVDLRVDDARDPLGELARLLRLQRAYETADWTTLSAEAPEGVRDLHAVLAAAQRGDRATAPARRCAPCTPAPAGTPGCAASAARAASPIPPTTRPAEPRAPDPGLRGRPGSPLGMRRGNHLPRAQVLRRSARRRNVANLLTLRDCPGTMTAP